MYKLSMCVYNTHKQIEKAQGLNLNNDLWIFSSDIFALE